MSTGCQKTLCQYVNRQYVIMQLFSLGIKIKVVQNVIRMSICDCQYVNMLECNYSTKVSIWKLFRMSSWCQNILARKVVQNVFMMSEHFNQKISTYTVFLVLTTSWLPKDWLRNLRTCSVLLVLLLNCYLHPTLDSCILKTGTSVG